MWKYKLQNLQICKTSSKLVKTHRRNSDINKKLHKDPQNSVKKN